MTETVQDETREAPTLPLHMRRDRFDPVAEMPQIREDEGVREVRHGFGRRPSWSPATPTSARCSPTRAGSATPSRRAFDAARRHPEISDEERERMRAGRPARRSTRPEHTRLRRMLTPEFTVRRMRRLEPRIVEIVDDHLDAMEQAGPPGRPGAGFALPIPSLVICELLGVPVRRPGGVPGAHRHAARHVAALDERLRRGPGEPRVHGAAWSRGAQANPGEDMLGMLVREHGDDLTTDELRHRASCC